MAYFPDLGHETQICRGPYVRAVGWLEPDHEYPRGQTSVEFQHRLARHVEGRGQSVDALEWPMSAGPHRCGFCQRSKAAGVFAVPAGDLLFVCPEMVLHYVSDHQYLPPEEFVHAVLQSPLPGSAEHLTALRRLRGLSA